MLKSNLERGKKEWSTTRSYRDGGWLTTMLPLERRCAMYDRNYIKECVARKLNVRIDEPNAIAISTLVEEVLNELMALERGMYLDNDQVLDKGNGFYKRSLSSGIGKMNLNVPRTRSGEFRPKILPPLYRRTESSYNKLLAALMIGGYSDAGFENFFREMELPYSKTELERLKEELKQKVEDFKTRQLPESLFAMFIDGYIADVKINGKVKKCCLYCIVGMDLAGYKTLLGFYTVEGAETRHKWREIFEDLIERGVKKVMVIISDDLSGLNDVIRLLFPKTDHQLCFVHLERNVRKHLKGEDASAFNEKLRSLRLSSCDFDSGVTQFKSLCQKYEKQYPTFIKNIDKKAELYLTFFKYPAPVRKYIYTTNTVENLNKQIETIRLRTGGYFQSENALNINVYLQYQRLIQGAWASPLRQVRGSQYEIRQLFALRFDDSLDEQTQQY